MEGRAQPGGMYQCVGSLLFRVDGGRTECFGSTSRPVGIVVVKIIGIRRGKVIHKESAKKYDCDFV